MDKKTIFETVFNSAWQQLPMVLKKRYANRSHTNDEVVVDGILDVHVSNWMKFLSPFLRLCGALVPYEGKNVPVTVCFNSHINSNAIGFNRTFNFADRGLYQFRSTLVPKEGDKVVEFMKYGLGWRMRYYYDGKKARLDHDGYIWQLFNITIPLPFQFILGKGYANEQAISDNEFQMYFEIIHPLFGKVFGYDGKFKISKVPM